VLVLVMVNVKLETGVFVGVVGPPHADTPVTGFIPVKASCVVALVYSHTRFAPSKRLK
jgi:hypothetical protein